MTTSVECNRLLRAGWQVGASRWLLGGMMVLLWLLLAVAPQSARAADPNQGPGGPILVVTSPTAPFGRYYAEILRNEGLNAFAVADTGAITAATLAAYDVVVLAKVALNATQVDALTAWVTAGGNLIAMAPDSQLAPLLGLTPTGQTLSEGYLLVNGATAPGNGIVAQTMQFHGTADRYTLAGATSVATLYGTATTATSNPAVTMRSVGAGNAAAFTYDLATSIVYTRQGNPAWAADERDGFAPIRSDDKFFGEKAGDIKADWVDLNKVAIPQADEQQRLLANLILHLNQSRKPLPRFWYFPNGKKAVLVMTGDDHGNGGTIGTWDTFKSRSPAGCSVADWECVRGTSYIFTNTPLTNAQAAAYEAEGFEVGLHINTGCADFTPSSLASNYATQIPDWRAKYSSVAPPTTQRHHCIAWSDWATGALVQYANGIRLDTSYYYWPPSWADNTPGMFTGSAMPMRFSALDGTLIDVYMAATQMTDESGQVYPYTVDTLLDRAIGPEGYYGAYVVNAHTDVANIVEATSTVTSALARGVPVVSSRQLLTWLDGRNESSFGGFAWNGSALGFTITKAAGARGLQAMLPLRSGNRVLVALTRGGAPVGFTVTAVKGIEYAFFAAEASSYVATYDTDTVAPSVTNTSPAAGATNVVATSTITATFSEAIDAATLSSATFELRDSTGAAVPAVVSYDASTRTAGLTPSAALAFSASYTATVRGGGTTPVVRDLSGNALAQSLVWSFTTAATPPPPQCPCSAWDASSVPTNPSDPDPSPVELGVKFRSDLSGYITGIRFYKGSGNTGTHVGNLWTNAGQLLATAVFSGESATGWQEVSFATPVAITANTVYVASYFAPNGRYASDSGFFASASVYKAPIRLLRDGDSGANGVYRYGASSGFPTQSYQASNYWVDVAFSTTPPSDTTPPTVQTVSPAAGATDVAAGAVTFTFSEAMDPVSLSANTVELRDAANTLVAATVSYDAATRTATLTPAAALAASTMYTATVRGGGVEPRVKDLAGNAMVANLSWSFTTSAAPPPPGTCPCTAWPSSAVPTVSSDADTGAVELGVKFRSDQSGYVTGVRFYKGSANSGTHIGNLWSSSGQLLATAVFTGETVSGWQQVMFSNPVAIVANTVYVASYFAPNGRYAIDSLYFAATGVDRAPLHLLRDGESGGNGVYAYGSASSFPNQSWQASNYWVDVVFSATPPVDTSPPALQSVSPLSGAVNVGLATTVSAAFNEAIDPSTIGASTFELRDASGVLVPASIGYDTASRTATLTPATPLVASSTYTVTLRGGLSDPRIKDLAGNALFANTVWSFSTATSGGPCASPANAVVAENCLPGNPASEWDISGVGDSSIQGFATDISVNRGSSIAFKVDTNASNYRFDIYRMGYYGGMGARKVATVQPSASLPQNQPNCLNDASTGLVDCGNWAVSGSWTVPVNAASGIYFAKLVRSDTGGASHIVFVVRDDASTSDLLFQTSDTTWQAYNTWGGNSLYSGQPAGRAYKVSYNRPFNTRIVDGGQDWLFNAEYPMVRWLESNGYDVSYTTGVDSDRRGNLLLNHRAFLSVGHDEYWSGLQRTNVEAARNAGVHLAFFSGNEIFQKIRWENSIDGTSTPYRTLVDYKETQANAKIDPSTTWTGTWRDPRFSPPADGGRPENALSGTIFAVNGGTRSIVVPEADGKMRLWRNTSIATLSAGQSATLPNGTLGYEWDIDADNGFRPPGLVRMSTTTATGVEILLDYGSSYGSGTATHHLTLYKHASGARVFGAGTIQWSWGLDANHDRAGTPVDVRMQQATVNLFADMGAQPATIAAGLVPATASADGTAPVSVVSSPVAGAALPLNTTATVSGTATDAGGVVGGVEVSVDNGATWHPANGRGVWSYSWTPTASGSTTIRVRAADDSGNLEVPGAGVTVTLGTGGDITAPTVVTRSPSAGATAVATSTTVTATFSEAMDAASISSTTFELRNAAGALVAASVSYNATTRVATLTPSAVLTGGATYTATVRGGTADPAVKDLVGNRLASNSVWSFTTVAGDATAPTVTARTPAAGATGVATSTAVTVTFSEAMDTATINATTIELRNSSNVLVTASVAYNATTRVATLTPGTALANSSTYTATVRGGAVDPAVKDVAGNPLAANSSWSFTTVAPDTTAPTVSSRSPASGATGVSVTAVVTATFNEAMDPATIGSSTFELRNSSGITVTGAVSYNAGTRVATFTPASAMAGGTTYTATIRGGITEPTVKDLAGNRLAANSTWSFTTGGTDLTPPVVNSTSPLNAAIGVSRTANMTATFSEAMNATTINGTTVELRGPDGVLVAAAVSYSATSRQVTLNPSPTLAYQTTYTMTIRGGSTDPMVRDTAGNALASSYVWSFTTLADTVAPTVSSTSPASGATGVSRTANVTVTFSEAMSPSSIGVSTIELRGPDGIVVPAVVTYDAANRRATLNPTPTLLSLAAYTVTVRGGTGGTAVTDLAGNPLAVDRVWTYTTRQ